jgi:hypothetical protein
LKNSNGPPGYLKAVGSFNSSAAISRSSRTLRFVTGQGNSPWSLRHVGLPKNGRLSCTFARTQKLGYYLVSGQLLNELPYKEK